MASAYTKKSRLRLGCLTLLVAFSAFIAFMTFPYRTWPFGAGLGTLAFVSIFLRVGWLVPFTIAGFYCGLFVLDPVVKGGTSETQMYETVTYVFFGTIIGFVIGAAMDYFQSQQKGDH